MKILVVGDIFSKLGREAFARNVKRLKEEHKINFIIANGENISHGKGMNEGHYYWLLEQGVNVITLGNHSFNQNKLNFYQFDLNNHFQLFFLQYYIIGNCCNVVVVNSYCSDST